MVDAGVTISRVSKVEQLDDFEDEYVYDIGVASNNPFFFANDILVHNSCYFSAYQVLKDHPDYVGVDWSREFIIELYDQIAEVANESFPAFMATTFNTSLDRGGIIKAGRELVASKALFIKKKKYAALMFDKEGDRLDVNGKPGKLKAMGLDLKRADTPKFMQKFLEQILMDLLTDKPRENLMEDIKAFRRAFTERPGWEKGTPKKVNGLSDYSEKLQRSEQVGIATKLKAGEKTKVNMPGHVRAAINWNRLCEINNDRYAMRIGDGAKVIVCKLKPNTFKMDSVAYPIDEMHLPRWFKELPFDHAAMEETIIDNKIDNLLGVLGWDFFASKEHVSDEFFSFGD